MSLLDTASSRDASNQAPLSRADFEARLRAKGSRYHIHHPFHVMMAEGKLNAAQLRG
mgnify:CR=1 FL=1